MEWREVAVGRRRRSYARRRPSTRLALTLIAVTILGSSCGRVCTLVGCSDTLVLTLVGAVPDTFTLTATAEWQNIVSTRESVRTCSRDHMDYRCEWVADTVRVWLEEFVAPTVNVTIDWGDSTVTRAVHPSWQEWEPNGPHCAPKCWSGTALLHF